MSKISLSVVKFSDFMAVARCLRPITGQSIAKIREAVEDGSPLFQQELFYNDHDEVADRLRRILASFEESSITFEVFEDERLISATVLRNILTAHDQIRQSDHL
ncbi:MAG TPA: hypothetical protein VF988_10655 [Verrucomicrobiae bacterium]